MSGYTKDKWSGYPKKCQQLKFYKHRKTNGLVIIKFLIENIKMVDILLKGLVIKMVVQLFIFNIIFNSYYQVFRKKKKKLTHNG